MRKKITCLFAVSILLICTLAGCVNPDLYTETTEYVEQTTEVAIPAFDLASIPAYSGEPYVAVHDNKPYFTDDELTDASFENYADLDSKERCVVAMASVGKDLMPTGERGSIGMIKPTGWHDESLRDSMTDALDAFFGNRQNYDIF